MKRRFRYGSVCSGIEAATTAWHPLGWKPVFFSEIEPFPCSVLAHHWPDVPNLGDMTKHKDWNHALEIDLLVGGTPCQAFSIAGLRAGLADPRGNLTLTFLGLVDQFKPRWVVWENVPGVLSDRTNAFGHFLSGLAEFGYGWAYRVLDAQYFGVAQRRRRVFVVACAGADWRRAAAVLFEPSCLRGNPPPSRQAGQGSTAATIRSTDGGSDVDHARGGHLQPVFTYAPPCSPALKARDCKGPSSDGDGDGDGAPLITHALRAEGFDASEDGTGRGTPLVPVSFQTRGSNLYVGDEAGTIGTNSGSASGSAPCIAFAQNQVGEVRTGDILNTLNTNSNASGRNTPLVMHPAAIGATIHGTDRTDCLRAFEKSPFAVGVSYADEVSPTLGKESQSPMKSSSGQMVGFSIATTNMRVRRLTPRECERLQGFPDDHTLVPHRGKPAADGPRYKAIGNSMAVPVMAWIGRRIKAMENSL